MRIKPLIIIFTIVCISAGAAVLFTSFDKNEPDISITVHEPQVTFNQTIGEAVTIYATAPYRRYSYEELHRYFICEIADEILKNYEPFEDPYEETVIEFEEQPLPEIGPIWITLEDGYYAVKLRFGEVFYNYELKIAPNRIITQLTDGGITFE
jgi:hypothetical protein